MKGFPLYQNKILDFLLVDDISTDISTVAANKEALVWQRDDTLLKKVKMLVVLKKL